MISFRIDMIDGELKYRDVHYGTHGGLLVVRDIPVEELTPQFIEILESLKSRGYDAALFNPDRRPK